MADLTEHWTDEPKLYCCAIKALFSNRIASWAIDSPMKARLVVAAIEMAVARHGMVGSAGDNAAMESFFALLQKNVLDRRRRWTTRDELRIAIVTWIEPTYHQPRRQATLSRFTPIEYETIGPHRPHSPPDPTCHLNARQSP